MNEQLMIDVRKAWKVFSRIWAFAGITFLIIFLSWSFIAYQPSSFAKSKMMSDDILQINEDEHYWSFIPLSKQQEKSTGFLFFPGALVDPTAYAPLLHEISLKGYPAILIKTPMRGIMGYAESEESMQRAYTSIQSIPHITEWVIAGHSRGALAAAHFARGNRKDIAGLVLIGTTHPRRFSLASVSFPVTKIMGSHDNIATVEYSNQHQHNLPELTQHIIIEGGNHSQFGHYGFQPGDYFATISRENQQEQTINAITNMLEHIEQNNSNSITDN